MKRGRRINGTLFVFGKTHNTKNKKEKGNRKKVKNRLEFFNLKNNQGDF